MLSKYKVLVAWHHLRRMDLVDSRGSEICKQVKVLESNFQGR